jgi:hypothetical protein
MKFETAYVVYRHYSSKEQDRPGPMALNPGHRFRESHLYGWTPNKATLKAFLGQRSQKKYSSKAIDLDELRFEAGRSKDDLLIEAAQLRSQALNETVFLFTTKEELEKVRNRIHEMFRELSSFEVLWRESITASPLSNFINMMTNLLPEYADALHFIGYRPEEINYVYDSVDEAGDAYLAEGYDIPIGRRTKTEQAWRDDDPSKQIIISFESVIKVLREEL